MLKFSLHTKWVARLLILIYLLLMASTGNAFFWCKDAETIPHLEANLGGKCWTPCSSETEEQQRNEQLSNPGVTISSEMGDCLDTPAYSSVMTPTNQNRSKSKVTAADIDPPDLICVTANRLSVEGLKSQSLSLQLPSRQALAALRTVVLRH